MNGRALRWLLIKLQPEAVTADHNTPHTAHIPAAERFRARPHERQHYRMYSYIEYTVFIYRLATFIYNFHKQAAPLVKTNHHVADGTLLQALPSPYLAPRSGPYRPGIAVHWHSVGASCSHISCLIRRDVWRLDCTASP